MHRLLLYGWWLMMGVGVQLASQSGLEKMVKDGFFPLLGGLALLHAVFLLWRLRQKVFAGSLPLSLLLGGMVLWALSAGVHLMAPLVDPGLASWVPLLILGGHGLFVVGAFLHLRGAGLWWWWILAYGVGWVAALRLPLPGGSLTVPPMFLGLGILLLYLGGSFGITWGIWLIGLLGIFLPLFPDVALPPELLPLLPVLGATLLLAGTLREFAHDTRIL